MAISYFLAKLVGPTLLVIGLGMVLNGASFRAMAEDFLNSRPLIYLAGLLAFVPGLAVVLVHNVWALDWRVLITLLGWAALVGGIFRIVFPHQVKTIGKSMIARPGLMPVGGAVTLALGALLSFYGYV